MQGVKVYLSSQCTSGDLHPELYRAGSAALNMGVEGGPQMTSEVHFLIFLTLSKQAVTGCVRLPGAVMGTWGRSYHGSKKGLRSFRFFPCAGSCCEDDVLPGVS